MRKLALITTLLIGAMALPTPAAAASPDNRNKDPNLGVEIRVVITDGVVAKDLSAASAGR